MTKTEAQTRFELIDQQLALAGWDLKDPTQVVEEFDILTALTDGVAEPRAPYEGHQFSDYVLLGKDRKPLAVIEAADGDTRAQVASSMACQLRTRCGHGPRCRQVRRWAAACSMDSN